MIRRPSAASAFTVGLALAFFCQLGTARAGIEDWQLNEVVTRAGGDPAVRYVELVNLPGGCLFPTSRVISYDPAGNLLGSVPLVTSATCFGPETYFLAASSAAVSFFGTTADRQMAPPIPAAAGQVCFVSSATHYDCVRWGAISGPVVDFFDPSDVTVAPTPGDGRALARTDTTHIVADDWEILDPTPRGPNDGTPWSPPDAGPTPDAAPTPDASIADAGPDAGRLPDARPRADASGQRYLDLDPAGGALCSCGSGRDGAAGWLIVVACVFALRRR